MKKQILHLIKSLFILFLTGTYTAYAGDSIPDVSRLAETTDILGSMGIDPYTKPERLRSTTKVGTPATSFDVSPTGGAVWQMAFDAPPGPGGMTPQIGLVYNSQSSMGIAGWGMSVSGLSVITRGAKSLHFDNATRGVKYDGGDALYLDGTRLILASGNEGQAGAVYHPEGDPFTDVTIKNVGDADGSLWYEVKGKDGITRQYGHSYWSRLTIFSSGVTKTAAWYVNRCEDANGNYADYDYYISGYTVMPSNITYGRNTNTNETTISTIEFTYSALPQALCQEFAIGGKTGVVNRRMEQVLTKTGNTVYRRYIFAYNDSLDGTARKCTRLTSVTTQNGQGKVMNPVVLSWEGMPELSKTVRTHELPTVSEPSSINIEDSVLVAADVNGDGMSDVVRFCNVDWTENGSHYYSLYAYVHFAERHDGELAFAAPKKILFSPGLGNKVYDRRNFAGGRAVLDFNGDGTDDLLIPYIEQIYSTVKFRVEYALGSDTIHAISYSRRYTMALTRYDSMPLYAGADVNSDGRCEALFLERDMNGSAYRLHSVSLGNEGTETWSYKDLTLPHHPKNLFTGDFNDDGLTDLIVLYEGGYTIFLNQGGSNALPFDGDYTFTGTSFGSAWRTEQGDYNGDGRVDFLYVGENSDRYYFAMNNGDGTFAVSLAAVYGLHDQDMDDDDELFSVIPMDIDHDGRTDAVVVKAGYHHHGGLSPWNEYSCTDVGWNISDGSNLTEHKRVTSLRKSDALACNLLTGDFDGDGYPELMNWGADYYSMASAQNTCGLRRYSATGLTAGSGKLASATDALGQTTSITYTTMADADTYAHRYGAAYPMADIHAPLHIVKTVYIPMGGGIQQHTFRYSGLKAHQRGKGLMGLASISDRNENTGQTVYNSVSEWDMTRFVAKVTRSGIEVDSYDAYTQTTMHVISSGSNNYYVRPLYKSEVDYDGFEAKTTYWHDSHGRLFDELTEYDMVEEWDMHKRTKYISYVEKGGRWLPTKVMSRKKHRDDETFYDVYTQYSYDDNGNPVQIIENWNTPLALTTTLTYDAFGNVTSRHTSGGVANVTEYTEYDPSGRFPVRKWQSPAGVENTYTYDTWGNVLTATDTTEAGNPLTTSYTRDGWGDVTAETDPTGVTTTYTWGWGTSMGEKFYKETTRDGSGTVTTWYDSSGRMTLTEEPGPGGVDISSRTNYDRFGEVSIKLRVTTGAQTVSTAVEQTFRDSRGRVSRKWYNTGAFTNYVYGDRCVTATDQNGRVTETEFDAWGNTVSTTDDAGNTVRYLYCSNGKPSAVTVEASDGSSSTVTMEYDAAGNRTLLNDPDAGEVTCEWSADGRLLSSTDARGYETVNTYDTLGRLVSSVTDSIATTYEYGTSGHGTQRLVSESRGGFTLSYTYDQYGRTSSVSRQFGGGITLTHTYIYDSYGRLQEKDYPSGLEAYCYYDDNGFLNGMQTNHNGDAWNLLSYDGLTMRTETGSDGLYATTVNDIWGKLTERYVTFGNSTDKLCRLAFTYDNETGNLTSRTGMDSYCVTEQFAYDNLDRLTSADRLRFTYSDNGNILSKTFIGSYTYSAAKPHAVTYVDNTSGDIKTHNAEYDAFGKVSCVRGRGTGGPPTPGIINGTDTPLGGILPGHGSTIIGWGDKYDVDYGPDGERWRSSYRDTTVVAVESTTHVNVRSGRDILYAGDYERVTDKSGTVREYHYLGLGVIAVITDGGEAELYHAVTDNIGSYVHLVNAVTGNADFSASFDAWGRMTTAINTLPFHRGYGGHEMLTEFGLVNMNGRMYDYNLGRFLSPDNYVQMPHDSQSFNRYSYCLNNPLKYTDPSGEVWWMPIVVGALIGGAISGTSYAVSVALTGSKWNGRDFLKSIGMGAFAGALSAGMGQVPAALGISKTVANSVGYKLFSQTTNSIVTNSVFDNSTDWSDVVGIAVSSLVAMKLPNYKATAKSAFSNFFGETVHNTLFGATTGFVQGAMKSLIKNDARYVFENTMGGAISGLSRTVALNALLGSPYKTHPAYDKSSGIIRRGGVFSLFANNIEDGQYMGVTLGRNSYSVDGNLYTSAHESYHRSDIEMMGWAAFYERILSEYIRYGFEESYDHIGTLEYNAKIFGMKTLKILSPPKVIMPNINFPF